MMRKNKYIILGFAVALVFAVLTGCSIENDNVKEGEIVNEFNNCSPEDKILKDYMMGVGYEYEDTLYLDLSERYGEEIAFYDSDEISLDFLENRSDEVIVERCYGMAVNRDGDGKVLNAYDEDYDYISYRRCLGNEQIREGTLLVTYFVYNPDTTYCDDIVERYDCVVSHEMED